MKQIMLFFALLFIIPQDAFTQEKETYTGFERKHFIGSQLFTLLTPILDPSPEYLQLNYGYRLTSKDELSVEAITWAYQGPIGRPYGPDYEQESTSYPGDAKSLGAGIAYKRLLWKGAFVQHHSTAFRQTYRDESKKKIQTGFMLFNTLRFGYHFKLFKKRWFLCPSIAMTYWPINTNLPDSFQAQEDNYPRYFLFEPGMQFGYTF